MNQITKIKDFTLLLVLFTLPMYIRLNNIVLLLFFVLFVVEGRFIYKWNNLKNHAKYAFPLALLFLLALLAAVNHPEKLVFKYLEKYWSFLIIPIAILSCREAYGKKSIQLFKALFLGCVATLLICYGNVVYEMIAYKEPLHYFLRFRHLNHQFTAIADTHPAYLGLFIVCSMLYVFLESRMHKWWKIVAIIFLTLGLIQLASRVALFYFIALLLVLLISRIKKHTKEILIGLGVVTLCSLFFFNTASTFLKERLISVEQLGNDERFKRHKVALEIFKEYPVFGIGFGRKDKLRTKKYEKYGFKVAASGHYNAHNQFFEYLSVNGIIGGLTYLFVVIYVLYLCWKRRSLFFFIVFCAFFIANITESMLVRIKGIEFFAITVSLLLTFPKKVENE